MISTETVDRYGNTMLLAYCKSGRYHVDGLSLLLSRGANLNARDSAGNSCLHSCFSCAYGCYNLFNPRDRSGARCIRSSLALLLRNGADIHAVNCYGDTVSHLAYDYHFNNTSYPGDLWDAVLAECGHEISSHRKYQPRKPKYSDGYTRQKFEELWEGMEHLCPYYDDELLGEVSDDESSTDSNDEVCSHDGDDDEESSQDNGEEEWDCSSSYPSEEAGDSSGSDSDGGGGCLLG
ncbi:hypothetical protein B0T14DRAFT_249015 [Immersiella caudata]|uniref:Uncharacterized protein n=1 Tax=Immersiella caudata TaxID=314043 RepID=A0AA39WJI1_9PEZI|nr:hypothetical protein B0T14DRAFT_249015 [Immersiella caudata]